MHRQSLAIEVATRYVTGVSVEHATLVILIEHGDLVTEVGGVDVDHPVEILSPDGVEVKVKLHASIDHITDIVIRTSISA